MDETATKPGEKCMNEKPTKPSEKCMDEKPTMDITVNYHMMETETGTGDYKQHQAISHGLEGNLKKKKKVGKKN